MLESCRPGVRQQLGDFVRTERFLVHSLFIERRRHGGPAGTRYIGRAGRLTGEALACGEADFPLYDLRQHRPHRPCVVLVLRTLLPSQRFEPLHWYIADSAFCLIHHSMIPTSPRKPQSGGRSPAQTMQKTGTFTDEIGGRKAASTAAGAASIKGKLQTLEEIIKAIRDEETIVTREVQRLRAEKDTLDNDLNHQSADCRNSLMGDVTNAEDEMQRHISNQKAENSRLQIQITQLKADKMSLQEQIITLTKRIQDIENSLGHEHVG